jgi:hypothetical protein
MLAVAEAMMQKDLNEDGVRKGTKELNVFMLCGSLDHSFGPALQIYITSGTHRLGKVQFTHSLVSQQNNFHDALKGCVRRNLFRTSKGLRDRSSMYFRL